MARCPACGRSNYQSGATFCSHCGTRLRSVPMLRRPRRTASIIIGCLLLLLLTVLYLARDPQEGRNSDSRVPVGVRTDRSRPDGSSSGSDDAPGPDDAFGYTEVDADGILKPVQVSALISPALVILELQGSEGRPLREIRGVVVDGSGSVLCRFTPLLGSYRATARFLTDADYQTTVRGICYRNEVHDLALVRLAEVDETFPWVSVLTDDPTDVYEAEDPLYVFSDHRAIESAIETTRERGPDGIGRIALHREFVVPPNCFLAVDAEASVVGLCRAEQDGVLIREDRPRPTDNFRLVVDTVANLEPFLDGPVIMTLQDVTQQFYEGTFADLFRRGSVAYRSSLWAEAISLLDAALQRRTLDRAREQDVESAWKLLREAYFQEAGRLARATRWLETAALMEAALLRYGDDPVLWRILGQARLALELPVDGIAALLEAQALQPSSEVHTTIEVTYLHLAEEAVQSGDDRQAELTLVEGIEQLVDSAKLHIALARLYMRFGAHDDAVRLLLRARELDSTLATTIESLLDRIDDSLRRRNAVIIPIPANGRSLRTSVMLDGREKFDFIIDTGATYTAIPSSMAEQLGYELRRVPRVNVRTAGGVIAAPLIQMSSVDVGGYVVRNIRVLVLPSHLRAGLLGLNFLNHFKYSVDAQRSEFRLERP